MGVCWRPFDVCRARIAIPWALISLRELRRNGRGLTLAGLMFALVLAPWTIRNAVVFGKFIPVKSNAAYELYQTLRYSDNGVVTPEVLDHHPGRNGVEGQEYIELGESRYLSRKSEQAKELLVNDPVRYLRQCGCRLWTMFVWEDDFYHEPDWPIPHWFCRLAYPLPLFGLLLILAKRQWRRDPVAIVAVLAIIGLAIPYVLVSYYERYEYAFGPAKMLLIYFGLVAGIRCFHTPCTAASSKVRRRAPGSEADFARREAGVDRRAECREVDPVRGRFGSERVADHRQTQPQPISG